MTSMSRTQRLSRLASAVVEAATGSRKGGWTKAAASGASHAVHSGKASVKKADSSTAPPPGQVCWQAQQRNRTKGDSFDPGVQNCHTHCHCTLKAIRGHHIWCFDDLQWRYLSCAGYDHPCLQMCFAQVTTCLALDYTFLPSVVTYCKLCTAPHPLHHHVHS
eukprot:evm.model.scf_3390.2 EVM.evm.TU.scf_3390.2   scf_3390:7629-8687(+)